MAGFKDISIKNKLILIQVATAFFAVLVCCVVFLFNDIKASKTSAIRNKYSIAEIIGVNLVSPLLFNDKVAANKILLNLKSNSTILNAVVLDKKGKVFTDYSKKGEGIFSFQKIFLEKEQSSKLMERRYIVTYSIFQEKEYVGRLILNAELTDLDEIIFSYSKVAALVLLTGILAAFFISFILQRTISKRLLSLVSKTKEVTATGNYSIRVSSAGYDEIGILSQEFNSMLSKIETSENDLKEANLNLEKRVKERTVELEKANVELESNSIQIKNSESFLNSIVENIPNMLFVKDAKDLRFVRFNKAGEELLGYTKQELMGKNDYDFFPKQEAEFFTSNDRNVLNSGNLIEIKEEPIHTKFKGERILETKKIPILDTNGKPIYLLGISNDITEQKRILNELKQKSEELSHSNQELAQFAYVASHDLQEPLRTISNYIGLIDENYSGTKNQDYQNYFSFISTATLRMQNLIKDLLEFSRVGRNPVFAEVDCNKIVKEVIADLDSSIKESHAKVNVAQLPVLNGIEIELKRLFQNLISNSIKFRKKDVPPEISIAVEDKDTEYLFSIKDNGIGIEEKFISKLFIIFQRLHTTAEYPGTGIGLVTAKKIVNLHKGKIWIESKEGEGSIFYFTIPKEITHLIIPSP